MLCAVPSHVHMYTHVHCVVLLRLWVCPVLSWFDIVYPHISLGNTFRTPKVSSKSKKRKSVDQPAPPDQPLVDFIIDSCKTTLCFSIPFYVCSVYCVCVYTNVVCPCVSLSCC